MKIAFVMDPLENVNPKKDTTYHLMLAAHQRGHEVYYLDQSDLFVKNGQVFGYATPTGVHHDMKKPFTPGEKVKTDMSDMGAVFIRTDPPFDRTYLYTTLILDLLPSTTRVLNRPSGLRNWNEKLAAVLFPDLTPPNVITQSAAMVKQFAEGKKRVILKPIDGFAGKGIIFMEPNSSNFDQILDMMTHGGRRRIIAQDEVPRASEGDKRILLLNGEPIGAILRLHPEGKELNNLDAGGSAHPTTLTQRDLEICDRVGPGLKEQGIFFAGIDILGDMLIEINVTSPTGLQQLCEFSGTDFNHRIIEAMEKL